MAQNRKAAASAQTPISANAGRLERMWATTMQEGHYSRTVTGVGRLTGRSLGMLRSALMTSAARLNRWDEIALEKITEMVSRKVIPGSRVTLAHVYLKRGALVPMHQHESEQMTYVLQGVLHVLVGDVEFTVREGEVLHIPADVPHQAEALDDTLELDVFCPSRADWTDMSV
jgi:quercetin dioxygenase-like cupin family protein